MSRLANGPAAATDRHSDGVRMQFSDKAKGLHLNRGDNKPQPCRHKCVGQFMNRKRNKGKHEGGQLTEHGCGRNKQQNAN